LTLAAAAVAFPPVNGSLSKILPIGLQASASFDSVDALGSFSRHLPLSLAAAAMAEQPDAMGSISRQLSLLLGASAVSLPTSHGSLSQQLPLTLGASATVTMFVPDSCEYFDGFPVGAIDPNWVFLGGYPWSQVGGRLNVPTPDALRVAERSIADLYPLLDSFTMSIVLDPTQGGEIDLFYDLADDNWLRGRIRQWEAGDPGVGPWRLEAYQQGRDALRSTEVSAVTDIAAPTGPGTLSVALTKQEDRNGYALYQVIWRWNGAQVWLQINVELNWLGQAIHGVMWEPGSLAPGQPYIDNYSISGQPCLPDFQCTGCAGETPQAYILGFTGVLPASCPEANLYAAEYPLERNGGTCGGWQTSLIGCSQWQPRAETYYEALGGQDRQVVRVYSGSPTYFDHEVFFETRPVPAGSLLCCEVFTLFLRSASPSITDSLGADWSQAGCYVDPNCSEPPAGVAGMQLPLALAASASSSASVNPQGSFSKQLPLTLAGSAAKLGGPASGFFGRQLALSLSAVAVKESPIAAGSMSLQLPLSLVGLADKSLQPVIGVFSRQLPLSLAAAASRSTVGAFSRELPLTLGASATVRAVGSFSRQLPLGLSALAAKIGAAATGSLSRQLPINLAGSATKTIPAAQGSLSRQLAMTLTGSATRTLSAQGSFTRQLPLDFTATASRVFPPVVGTYQQELPLELATSAAILAQGSFSQQLPLALAANGHIGSGFFSRILPLSLAASADVDETTPGGGCAVCSYTADWRGPNAEDLLHDGVWQSPQITIDQWKVRPLRPLESISPVDGVQLSRCVRPNFNPSNEDFELESLHLQSTINLSSITPQETFDYSVYVLDGAGSQIRLGYGHDGTNFRVFISRPGRSDNIVAPISTLSATVVIDITRELPPPNPRYGIVMRVNGIEVDSATDLTISWREQTEFGHIVNDGPNIGATFTGGFHDISISVSPCTT
jgi:hypothetical protein